MAIIQNITIDQDCDYTETLTIKDSTGTVVDLTNETITSSLRKTYSSVLGVLAFLNVPIVYYSVEVWQDRLHPPTNTKSQLPPSMTESWLVSWLALTLLYVFLLILRTQLVQMKSRIDVLQYDQVNR